MSLAPPTSTYRVQLNERFTLFDAASLVPYLVELGVGAIYVSPLLQSTHGSAHGYDVVDHGRIDAGRGGHAGLEALAAACRAHGLGLLVDIVPNHMGVAVPSENTIWWALLRDGQGSAADEFFDVDWPRGGGKVLLPILEPDANLDELLSLDGDALSLGGLRLPIAAGTREPGDIPVDVLARQHYAPVEAARADVDQNYRRFFAVSTLAGIRVENDAVFEESHGQIRSWVSSGLVSGLRVDHPDGLADPTAYLERLAATVPDCWLVVEKILEPGEELPDSWPVAGTTGYDALAEVGALFIDPSAEAALDATYRELTGDGDDWATHAFSAKFHVASTMLRAEVLRIARLLPDVESAADAIAALAAALPVYRTYLPIGLRALREAAVVASDRVPELGPALECLLPRLADGASEAGWRFQQLTGAVMAKGVEDTALYRFTRLIALNEVGSSPALVGADPAAFHAAAARRLDRAPASMTTLSTHDTKRGEDLRARIAVLAELPAEWSAIAGKLLDLEPVPRRPFGYLLWQTFVAAGLIERERMHAFAEKAMREADQGTSWRRPDPRFESAVHAAVDGAYDHPETRSLIAGFAERLAPYGWSNAFSAKLVQLTMPGVPDCYQGSERYAGSLVDPDNRRPVDFAGLAVALARLGDVPPGPEDPEARKQALCRAALVARRDRPELFGGYAALEATGVRARHVVAFDRGGAVTVVTRLPVGLEAAGGFAEELLELPPGRFIDVLSDERYSGTVRVAELLGSWPAVLLLSEPS